MRKTVRTAALGMISAAVAIGVAPALASAAPAATNTGPDAGVLAAHLLDQPLTWGDCSFPGVSDSTTRRLMAIPGAACATVTVPRDWHHPTDGNTITLRVSRTATADPATRQGFALVNPGGPGGSGLVWGPGMAMRAPELAKAFDFFGFDPRGVGQSTPLICEYTPDPDATYDEQVKAKAEACLTNPLMPYITTEQTAYDMDFLRALFGEQKLNYIGYSYGTWLGKWYQSVFPATSGRFVLDSSTDLTRKSLEGSWDLQPRSRDRQFQEHLLPYMARNAEKLKIVSDDPMEIRRYWELGGGNREFFGQMMTAWYILPAMYDTTQYPDAAWAVNWIAEIGVQAEKDAQAAAGAETTEVTTAEATTADARARLDAFVTAYRASGVITNPESAERRIAASYADLAEREATEAAAAAGTTVKYDYTFDAVRCQDGQWNRSEGYWKAWVADLERKAPWIAPFMSAPACRYIPAQTSMPAQAPHAPAALILQAELDAATPYESGARSAQVLNNTSLISIDNEGSHGIYPYGTECVDDPVETYFLTGVLPAKNVACGALPLPGESEAFPVAGDFGPTGKLKLKMRTEAVKEANALVRALLAETAAATP